MPSSRFGFARFTPLLCLLGLPLFVLAQHTPGVPPGLVAQSGSQPAAAGEQAITARVIDVRGDVQHAPLDGTNWQPCKLNDEYPPQTQIRTGLRSSIKLQIGDEQPYTVVVVEAVGKTILSEAVKTSDTKRVRIGVGYGKIRAGVAEGGLQSDFTVDTPVATLSKKGTWNFGAYYERGTERFEFFLLDRGLIEVLDRMSGQSRQLTPGEFVTQAMLRWADEAQLRTSVPITDILGQEDVAVAFNDMKTDGLGVLGPGSGRTVVMNLSNESAQNAFANLARNALPPLVDLPSPPPLNTGPFVRPEGFFGTGRGEDLIPILIDANNPLAQQGFARPGRYVIRRQAVEGWLRQTGRR